MKNLSAIATLPNLFLYEICIIINLLTCTQADPSEDTLRLIAAMCVIPKVQNMVNYEDIITFLNEAIRLTQNG